MAGSPQLTVNKETGLSNGIVSKLQDKSKSIIQDLILRLTKVENLFLKNDRGYDNKKTMLVHLKNVREDLNEISKLLMNSGQETTGGALVKAVLESILQKLSIILEYKSDPETDDDDQEAKLLCSAAQFEAEFDKLKGIVSNLIQLIKLQEIRLSIIQLRLLTIVESDMMLDHLKNLSADLKNLSKLLINSWHDTAAGALVKAILESILHKSVDETDDDIDRKLASLIKGKLALKEELDKFKGIVSDLIDQFMKLQLPPVHPRDSSVTQLHPGDSKFKDMKITEINTTVIPAVLTRLELVNTYYLFQNPGGKYQSTRKQVKKLTADLDYIKSFLTKLEENSNDLGHKLGNFVEAILSLSRFYNLGTSCKDEAKQLQAKLRVLRKVVVKLKRQISQVTELQPRDSDDHWYAQVRREFVLDMLPVLHLDENFLNSSAFRGFREVYESLNLTTKMCLLCFAVIPENEVVKKGFMTHWWEAEGFVSPPAEEAADRIFQELVKMGCIEPVNEKHKFAVNRYEMDPFIRTAVIVLAKEAGFFDFDDTGNPSANFKKSYRACLVEGCFQELSKRNKNNELDPEKLQVLFNINVPYPDYVFKFKGFSKLKNVKVVYLGRWQSSANHYIEVESTKFLAGLKSMKLLKFLSLQGIYRIRELPRSVCELPHLRILDLRGCHNLEALPDWIGSIRTLTYLDISECYLLHYIPKRIANLNKLLVLKGFLISQNSGQSSCTFKELSELKKLTKLSIYVKMEDFPKAEDVNTLEKFKALQKLTITWAVGGPKPDKGAAQPIEFLHTLVKLDLKCYPHATAPSWLRPKNLPMLKKLYIRGGNLQNLSPVQENDKWPNVKVLRLKFLSDLKMDWKKLRSLFPGLDYLENFKCPNLSYFPCNENGVVWLKPRTEIKIE